MSMSPPTLDKLMLWGETVGRKNSQIKSNVRDEEVAPCTSSASKALVPGAPVVLRALCPRFLG